MNEHLRKRHEILTALLTEAHDQLRTSAELSGRVSKRLAPVNELVEHREFEVALDILQDIGGEFACPASFWRKLKQATDAMGLEKRRDYLRSQ